MTVKLGVMGLVAAGALLTLTACGGGNEQEQAQTDGAGASTPSATAPGETGNQARAEGAADGSTDGTTPAPAATAGATPGDVNAPLSPAEASAAAGGGSSAPATTGGTGGGMAAAGGGVVLAGLTGNADAGAKVFRQCATCHSVKPGENKVGPSLHGIIGRQSGTIPGFRYSTANKNSNVTWTEDVMFRYLEAPQKFMPGTFMSFAGLKQPQQRADVIAYLKTQS